MAKASINFTKAKGGGESEKHMDRDKDHKVTYLLDNDSKNNEYKTYSSPQDYLELAKDAAKEKTGRTMQKLAEQNFIQEAVLNLNENHMIDDVEKVFENLQKEFGGFEVFKIAVHRDEGVFLDTEHDLKELEYDAKTLTWLKDGFDVTNEVIDYAPGRNIFYNEQNTNWYLDKQFTQEANTNKLQIKINYHAHVQFTKFDMNEGKNARLQKKDMSKIQDINARSLSMERGINYGKEGKPAAKRMNHYQLKQEIDKKRETKTKVLAKIGQVKEKYKEHREQFKEEGGHSAKEYQALKKIYDELEKEARTKNLTIDSLRNKIETYEFIINEQNKELEVQISPNSTLDTPNTDKNDLKAISDDLSKHLEMLPPDREKLELERDINSVLEESIGDIVKRNTKTEEKKIWGGLGTETIQTVDVDGLIKDFRKREEKHINNYQKLGKYLNNLSRVIAKVMDIAQALKMKLTPKRGLPPGDQKRIDKLRDMSSKKDQGLLR